MRTERLSVLLLLCRLAHLLLRQEPHQQRVPLLELPRQLRSLLLPMGRLRRLLVLRRLWDLRLSLLRCCRLKRCMAWLMEGVQVKEGMIAIM